MRLPRLQIPAARLTARVLSVVLFILWGSFFVEHLSWFGSLLDNPPPVSVWLLSLGHFVLLISYLAAIKWEHVGSIVMTLSAVFFFSFAAGSNAIPFIIVSIFPAMLYFFCWIKERKNHTFTMVH